MTTEHAGSIVVGVDGSPSSHHALDWAIEEAGRRGLPLHIVHANNIDHLVAAALLNPPDESLETDDVVDAALRRLDASGAQVNVSTEASTGAPARDLVTRSADADTVVLGARGRGGIREALGSVSLQVAMHAQSPVVVVRGGGPERGGQRGVVVGVDGSELSSGAVGYAFEQASSRAVPLTAVNAWSMEFADGAVVTTPTSDAWRKLEEHRRRMVAEALAGWREKYPDVDVEVRIERARPADALVSESEGAELVVVGARGRGGFAGLLLGSVSHAVLHRAHCAVAVVRPR